MSVTTHDPRTGRSYAELEAHRHAADAADTLAGIHAGSPVDGTLVAAAVRAILAVSENVSHGTREIAEAVSDLGVIMEASERNAEQRATDLAEQVGTMTEQITEVLGELAERVDDIATYARMGLPWHKRLQLRIGVWRWNRRQIHHVIPMVDEVALAGLADELTAGPGLTLTDDETLGGPAADPDAWL